jgi:hypothetical protein
MLQCKLNFTHPTRLPRSVLACRGVWIYAMRMLQCKNTVSGRKKKNSALLLSSWLQQMYHRLTSKLSDSYLWGELYWHLHCSLLGCACPRCTRRTCQFEWRAALRDTFECQPTRLAEIVLMKLSRTGSSFPLYWTTHHAAQTWIHLLSLPETYRTSGLERIFSSVQDVKRAVKMCCCR